MKYYCFGNLPSYSILYVERVEVLLSSACSAAGHQPKHREVDKYFEGLYFSDPESGRDEVRWLSNLLVTAVNWDWRATSRKRSIQAKMGIGTWHRTGNQRNLMLKPRENTGRRRQRISPTTGATDLRWRVSSHPLQLGLETCSLGASLGLLPCWGRDLTHRKLRFPQVISVADKNTQICNNFFVV